MTRPDCRKSTLFDDLATEPPQVAEGIERPHRVRQLRHGLTAIYVTRAQQLLIAAGILPDPVRSATHSGSATRCAPSPSEFGQPGTVPTYAECMRSWDNDTDTGDGAV